MRPSAAAPRWSASSSSGASNIHTPSALRDKRLVGLALAATVLFVYISMRPVPSPERGGHRTIVVPSSSGGGRTRGGFDTSSTATENPPPSTMSTTESSATEAQDKEDAHTELPIVTEEYIPPTPQRPLNEPHGGKLIELVADAERARELTSEVAPNLASWTLSTRQLCDLELLMNGGFSPLDGFMDEITYKNVLDNVRLGDGYQNKVWPMPVTLDVSSEFAASVKSGDKIALRDEFFNLLAIFTVKDKYTPDKQHEAEKVFGTTDQSHPAVDYLFNQAGPIYLGGSVEGVQLPIHYDFPELRRTPAQLRKHVSSLGWSEFLAFQTRNPMHRAHIELTRLTADEHNVPVVIHPSVGMTKPGDVAAFVRIRCYKAILDSHRYYKRNGADLSLLPLAMRMGGPREALWHAIIRKNYGASHFTVGRDHAGCKSAAGEDFYGPYDAQQFVNKYIDEVGIKIVKFKKVVYVPKMDKYLPQDRLPEGAETMSLSGTQFRKMMNAGDPIPAWFSDPEVIKILQTVSPPRFRRGFSVFFTGLSGGGKTTISNALIVKLREVVPTRHLTILDGDVSRTHLSSELGFSVHDRNVNVARMGYVASEAVRHSGIVVASTIAPFEKARAASRDLVTGAGGGFVLVHVSTSAEECARRDVKGLYAKARAGDLALTGVSHPYEFPDSPDLTINAGVVPVETSVDMILAWLQEEGYLTGEQVGSRVASLDLASEGVRTSGIVDPASRICANRAGGVAGSARPRLVYVVKAVSGTDGDAGAEAVKNKLASAQTSSSIVTIPETVVKSVAERIVKARLQESARRWGKDVSSVSVDDPVATSTEDDAPEIAYQLWTSARVAALKKATEADGMERLDKGVDAIEAGVRLAEAPEHVAVVLPASALKYMTTTLRLDPCASIVVAGVKPDDAVASFARGLQDKYAPRVAVIDKSGQDLGFGEDEAQRTSLDNVLKGK